MVSLQLDPLVFVSCQLCESDKPEPLYKISGFKEDPREFKIVRCQGCGFVYINPTYSKKVNIDSYETTYYTDQVADPSGKVRSFLGDRKEKINDHRVEWEFIKKHKMGGKILDLGSGPGFFLDALEGRWEKFAVDTSKFSISNIQDPEVNKFKGELLEACFEENFFDAIYMGHTLDRLTNLKETLSELNRILKPGGIICIVTPNFSSLCAKVFKNKYRLLYSNHLIYFSPKTLKQLFERNGFKLIDIYYPFFGTSFFSYTGFLKGTGKIIIQAILNLLSMPQKLVSPPYRGNIICAIISKD
ncbi:MAG TPA: class I SAM-dependent methyltransferase [Nitrospinaceae bacterium]|nr:class I SAM-dependent methyltransferase [Nitrospinaceae bacterium]